MIKFLENYHRALFLPAFVGGIIIYFYLYRWVQISFFIASGSALSIFILILIFQRWNIIYNKAWFYILIILVSFILGLFVSYLRISQLSKITILQKKADDIWIVGKVEKIEKKATYGQKYIVQILNIGDDQPNYIKGQEYKCEFRDSVLKERDDLCLQKIRVNTFADSISLKGGQIIRTKLDLRVLPKPVVPRGYDYSYRAFFKEVSAISNKTGDIEVLDYDKNQSFVDKFNIKLKEILYQRITAVMDDKEASITKALIAGDRSFITQELRNNINKSGLSHLIAISGLHMVIISSFIFILLRKLLALNESITLQYNIKKIASCCAILFAFWYLGFVGYPISARRAYIMLFLVLLGVCLDRMPRGLISVSIAAFVILCFNPEDLFTASFQLSFAAASGLIAAFDFRTREVIYNPEKGMVSRVIEYNKLVLLSSLVANLATLLFVLYHFNQIAIYGIFANLLAIPLVSFVIMPLSVLGLLTTYTPLSYVFFYINKYFIISLVDVIQFFANLKFAVISFHGFNNYGLFIIAAGIYLMILLRASIVKNISIVLVMMSIIYFVGVNRKADIIIDDQLRNIAVRKGNTLYVINKNMSTYKKEQHSRRNNIQEFERVSFYRAEKDGILMCNYRICKMSDYRGLVILKSLRFRKKLNQTKQGYWRESEIADLCSNYDIVINMSDLELDCDEVKTKNESLFYISFKNIREFGSIYLYKNGKESLMYETVEGGRINVLQSH